MKFFITGPCYNEEEKNNLVRLKGFLEENGISSFIPEIEYDLIQAMSENNLSEDEIKVLSDVSLSSDVYTVLNDCDGVIGIISGRVPDEATVIKLGLFYALDVPVYLYKYDVRTAFKTGDNSMISGLSEYKAFNNPVKMLKTLRKVKKEIDIVNLSPNIKYMLKLGEKVNKESEKSLINLYKEFKDIKPLTADGIEEKNNKVYCSGPLFSPDEMREMKKISDILEGSGYDTYLPHRDGAEAYFMNSAGNAFAGSPFLKPFIKIIDKMIFQIDVLKITECGFFVVNLNGRAYDEGAMAEIGIAYALNKPVTVLKTDIRGFIGNKVHPVITAVSSAYIEDYKDLPSAVKEAYLSEGNYGRNILKAKKGGRRGSRVLSFFKKPKNKMLNWLEDYDEKR